MSLRAEVVIEGRPVAVRRASPDGPASAFLCLVCRSESAPERRAFAAHDCQAHAPKPARRAPAQTPPAEVRDAEG